MSRNDINKMKEDFERMERELNQFVEKDFPIIVAVEAENHYKRSFDNQGFTDTTLVKWKSRDVDTNPQKYSRRERERSAGRAILIGHGSGDHMRDSIYTTHTSARVDIMIPKPYAQVHNEGGQAGRNLSATIPQRQFVGKSAVLNEAIKKKVELRINQIFKR